MKTELVVINPREYGLEEKQAEKMTSGLAVVLTERKALEGIYNAVIAKELNAETFKEARELRLKVQKNRTTGIEAWHKTNKAFYLAGGRFVDAYKNKEVIINEQMEERLLEIEKYEEKLASDLKAKLKAERLALLEPFEVDTQYVSIEEMTEDQFNGFLNTNKVAFETKIEQQKQAELARIVAENKAETERLENLRIAKIEQDKKDAELAELQKKQALRDKRAIEMKNYVVWFADYNFVIELPEEEYQKELLKAIDNEKKQNEFEIAEQKKRLAEKAEQDKKDAELKKEQERLQAENDKLKQQQEQEKSRIEAEEAEKLANEKALANAGDREKVKHFFETFKSIAFPDLTSEDGKKLSKEINEGLALLRKGIVEGSKNLL